VNAPHPRWRLDVGAVFVYLALGAAFVALPRTVVDTFGGSTAMAGLSVSVFFVAAVVARPFAGRVVDRVGRRPVLVIAQLVVGATMALLAVAPGVWAVLVLRFVQGLAGGSFYVGAVTAETDMAPPDRRASAVARLSIAIYGAFAVGPLVGEAVIGAGQVATFLLLALLPAVGVTLTATVPETRPGGRGTWSSETVAPGPGAPEHGEGTTGTHNGGLIERTAIAPGVTLATMGVGYATVTALSALYAPEVGLASAGVLYGTFAITILVLRLGAGRLADTVGHVAVMLPGMGVFVAGFVVAAAAVPTDIAALAVGGVLLVGAGWALVFPAVVAWLADRVPDERRGAALGTAVAFMDIGQGSGGYLVGGVADLAGFGVAYLVPAALAAGGTVVLALAVRGRAPEVAEG
jgi:MFS family permease